MTTADTSTDTMPDQNLYKVLSVSPAAGVDEIRKAITREMRVWSNRTNAPQMERRQEAERMVKLLEQAESILLDANRKAAYDQKLQSAPAERREIDNSTLAAEDDLVHEARRLLSEGEVADALYVAEKATQTDGGNPEAWAVLGQARFRWGDIEDAIYEYRRAIKLKPNEAVYYFDLGSVLESADRPADALKEYKRAAEIEPQTTMYRAAMGALLIKNEIYADGIEVLEHCLSEEPDNETYQWFLAIAYVDCSTENWTDVGEDEILPEGKYATEKRQVLDAMSYIAKAQKLNHDDDDLRAHIREKRAMVDNMLKRKFYGSYLVPIIGAIIWVFVFGIGLILGPLYFIAARPPQYAVNKRLLKRDFPMGWTGGGDGFLATLFGSAIIGLFLPIMVLWNFIKNYTGENALPKDA